MTTGVQTLEFFAPLTFCIETGTCSAKRVDIEILVWKMIYESFFQLVLSVFCTGASDDYYGSETMMLAISITLDIRLGQQGTITVIMI